MCQPGQDPEGKEQQPELEEEFRQLRFRHARDNRHA
jgi:hypothetical protein